MTGEQRLYRTEKVRLSRIVWTHDRHGAVQVQELVLGAYSPIVLDTETD